MLLDFYGEMQDSTLIPSKYQWETYYKEDPHNYGWVVEYDPHTKKSQKLLGLGRFAHEGAAVVEAPDGRAVVYMGDDLQGEHIYKFISDKKGSLISGTLFVAHFESGKWLALDVAQNKELKNKFKTQNEMLIHTRAAAKIVGATGFDRPEDIEWDKKNKNAIVALTGGNEDNTLMGSLIKISEQAGDPTSLNFTHSVFKEGSIDMFILHRFGFITGAV